MSRQLKATCCTRVPEDPVEICRALRVCALSETLSTIRIRIVLNVSLSAQTRSARQISTGSSGTRVQHVAFSCRDIFSTVEQLRARGVRFVRISGNYYDDLIARLALDEALVSRMRAL